MNNNYITITEVNRYIKEIINLEEIPIVPPIKF